MEETAAAADAASPEDAGPGELARQRIAELASDPELPGVWGEWVRETASFLAAVQDDAEAAAAGLAKRLAPEAYDRSWLNYGYAVSQAGECGRILCFLSSEVLASIAWKKAGRTASADAYAELFLLAEGSLAAELEDGLDGKILADSLRETVSSMYWDYLELFFAESRGDKAWTAPVSVNPKGRGMPWLQAFPRVLADHGEDAAVYLDRAWMERYLELASGKAGKNPAFVPGFLDTDAAPAAAADPQRPVFGTKQQHLRTQMRERIRAVPDESQTQKTAAVSAAGEE